MTTALAILVGLSIGLLYALAGMATAEVLDGRPETVRWMIIALCWPVAISLAIARKILGGSA